MFGKNKKLGVEKGSGEYLKVHAIFSTIQGEGPYSGRAAIFIRLSGCNLACEFCDTEFDFYQVLSTIQVLDEVKSIDSAANLIVITGGEPLRQNINLLCKELLQAGYEIQIETNGTIYQEVPDDVKFVCSPKMSNESYSPIRKDVLQHTIAIKFLISSQLPGYSKIEEVGQSEFGIPVYVQPIDEGDAHINFVNTELAVKLVKRHNARLSLQVHKIIGIE